MLHMYLMIPYNFLSTHNYVEDQSSGKSSKSLSSRIIGIISTSVPTKVTDDPARFAMIMSEFRAYEQHKQVKN